MKKLFYLLTLTFLSLNIFSQTDNWREVNIPGICKFKIPHSMELREKGSFDEEAIKQVYNIESENRVVIQPRGFSDMEYLSTQLYARIIVEYMKDDYSEYADMMKEITNEDLKEISDIDQQSFKEEADQHGIKIIKISNTSLKKIGNKTGLYYNYTRGATTSNKNDVIVHFYRIFNKDSYVEVRASYRTTESGVWENDIRKSLSSFVF